MKKTFFSNKLYIILLILTTVICFCYSFFSNDRLPIEYSVIFDERFYIDNIQNFSKHFYYKDFVPYYNSRLLIPLFAGIIIKFLHIESNIQNIQTVLLYLNVISILIGIVFYYKIGKLLKFSQSIMALGFSLLFLNFFILKFSFYYPILMDVFGFTSGIIIFYFYLTKKLIFFYITLFITMFLFPTTIIIAVCYLASSLIKFVNKGGLQIISKINLYAICISLFAFIFIIFLAYYNLIKTNFSSIPENIQFSIFLLPLSIVTFSVFIYFLVKNLLPIFDGIALNLKKSNIIKAIVSLFIIISYLLISNFLSSNFKGSNPLDLSKFLNNLLIQYLSFPLKFLVSHFIYFGIFIIIFIHFRRILFLTIKTFDPLLKMIFTVTILLMLGTESRQLLQLYPFLILILLMSLKECKFSRKFIFVIFAFQLVASRFWYSINNSGGFLGDLNSPLLLQNYPAQRYFQFQGPWISTSNSLLYGLLLIICYGFFVYLFEYSSQDRISNKLKVKKNYD